MPEIVQYYCERCDRYFAEADVVTIAPPDGRARLPGCPSCRAMVRREEQTRARPLERAAIADALRPIFAKENLPLLIATTFVGFFVWRFVPIVGALVALGILLSYAAEASRSAADPRTATSLGQAADFSGWGDLLGPILRRLIVLGIALAPLVLTLALATDPTVLAVGTLLGALFYVLYTPAGLIVAAQARSFATVLSPIAPAKVAHRMGGAYLLAAGLHLLSTIGGGTLVALAFGLAGVLDHYVAFFPFALAWAVLVVVTTFQARLLGIVVREHRHELGIP